jgi:septal ring factor EnvC (AmiA/AmiB activator)
VARAAAVRDCVLTGERDGRREDLCLRARAVPILVEGSPALLLFLDDVTADRRRAALERAFLHDLRNALAALLGAVEELEIDRPPAQAALAREVRTLARRLAREIEVHQALSAERDGLPRQSPTGKAQAFSGPSARPGPGPLRGL